jgi:hypothetical protein
MDETGIAPEKELLDYVQRLGWQGYAERFALHLQFSALQSSYQKPEYLQIASRIFVEQIGAFGGRYFALRNGDIVYIAREASADALDRVVGRIKALFAGDPATLPQAITAFYTRYDLLHDYARLRPLALQLAEAAEAASRAEALLSQMIVYPPQQPLDPLHLVQLEQRLITQDIAPTIRRQSICGFAGKLPTPLFDEVFISINDLCTLTGLHVNVQSDPWLFRYVTRLLDQKILTYCAKDTTPQPRPFSLNLNIDSIVTPAFQQFNTNLSARLRHTLIVELHALDVLSNISGFYFVRDYLHERGYRLCLDGVTHQLLAHYNRKDLGFDFVKLRWTPDSLPDSRPDSLNERESSQHAGLAEWVKATGQERVILCRCDSQRAISLGQQLGIVMFQGRELDRMLLHV